VPPGVLLNAFVLLLPDAFRAFGLAVLDKVMFSTWGFLPGELPE
jgi:hypothetical protein